MASLYFSLFLTLTRLDFSISFRALDGGTCVILRTLSSEYTVNAMDAEELRKSQRRLKQNGKSPHHGNLGRQLSSRSDNMPSQESDIDDDLGMDDTPTTPGADNVDRSISSVFSVR